MAPPLLLAPRPRNPRSALALSLLWPGLGQFHNRQPGLGTIALLGNTALYLSAIPWGWLGRVYTVMQEQSAEIAEGRADPGRALALIIKTASTPLPRLTAALLGIALFAALGLHAFLCWHAWLIARKNQTPPSLPA